MAFASQPGWDQLLQQSENLAARDGHGYPRIERDWSQLASFSSSLNAKAQATDVKYDSLAATQLLAQEGVDTRSLEKALQTVEIRPSYEDVFTVEHSSLAEYLQQVHEMAAITSIEEANLDSLSSSKDYLKGCSEADWAAAKRQHFDVSAIENRKNNRLTGPLASSSHGLAPMQALVHLEPKTQLSQRESEYIRVVRSLNTAVLSQQPYSAVDEFASEEQNPITMLWEILRCILRDVGTDHLRGSKSRQAAMLRGACGYLEQSHAQHIQSTIQANRAQANLGGAPSRIGLVQAFLRIKERGSGALDFDTPGGLDTAWHQIFICLRSGYYQEAVEEAKRLRDAPIGNGQTFAKILEEWVGSSFQLLPESSAAVAEECEKLKTSADRRSWQQPAFRFKFATFALLAGEKRAAETMLREGATLFGSIEDFMWYKLALIRSAQSPKAGGSNLRISTGRLGEPYKLSDLQEYLKQFPPAHYSQGGERPLLYATVLLLSLQFELLVAFLAKDPSSRSYRTDAPHFAIALTLHQAVKNQLEELDVGDLKDVQPGEVIHSYGAQFAASDPEIALEYYILAARAMGNSQQTKARLLRELLTESNAFGFLLGSGGSAGGALDKWLGSPDEKQQLLEAVAYECNRAGQLDWACELYFYAGAARPALHLLNKQISSKLELAPLPPEQEEQLESLWRRAAEAVATLSTSPAAADKAEETAFKQLRCIEELLRCEQKGNNMQAARLLTELKIIPTDGFRIQHCTEEIASLHPAVVKLLPKLLLAAARALAGTNQVGQLRTAVTFAGNLTQYIGHQVLQELKRIYNGAS